MVVTGTMRDSLHVLDVILNPDGGPAPQMNATDTASYSDIVFGLFHLLGYQSSPRLADMPDQRPWRLTVPGGQAADYGTLSAVATNKLSAGRIRAQWADMLRVVGSLHSGSVAGGDPLRMLGRDSNPTPLGAAFVELAPDMIRERTMAGLAAARTQDRTGGRPSVMNADTLAAAQARHANGESPTRIAKALGVSRASIYRHLPTSNTRSMPAKQIP